VGLRQINTTTNIDSNFNQYNHTNLHFQLVHTWIRSLWIYFLELSWFLHDISIPNSLITNLITKYSNKITNPTICSFEFPYPVNTTNEIILQKTQISKISKEIETSFGMPMHIGNHFPLQPSFYNLTKLPQFPQVYQI
jgi:hypothetical protein